MNEAITSSFDHGDTMNDIFTVDVWAVRNSMLLNAVKCQHIHIEGLSPFAVRLLDLVANLTAQPHMNVMENLIIFFTNFIYPTMKVCVAVT